MNRINNYNMDENKNKENIKSKLDKILEAALENNKELLKDKHSKKKINPDQFKLINNFLEQYFDCYILISYDTNDSPVTMQNIKSLGEKDKLYHSLGRFMATGGMGGEDDDDDFEYIG